MKPLPEIPNATTSAAMQEVSERIRTGSGQRWTGNTEDFFALLDGALDGEDADAVCC